MVQRENNTCVDYCQMEGQLDREMLAFLICQHGRLRVDWD